jgi:hypothetical protein
MGSPEDEDKLLVAADEVTARRSHGRSRRAPG